ncbi:hypothetical protein DL98DRAFT_535106 [Cadophora sp. DSE1049]|nr:hypothetical protein DL98DRAFT_535106 [Cadophora sp. DSE1049]
MKIINVNHDPDRVKAECESSIVAYLQRLQIETGEPQHQASQFALWTLQRKEVYRDLLEKLQKPEFLRWPRSRKLNFLRCSKELDSLVLFNYHWSLGFLFGNSRLLDGTILEFMSSIWNVQVSSPTSLSRLFSRGFQHPHLSKIQRLALGQHVFCNIQWVDFEHIAEALACCEEICVVIDDTRSAEQMSLDVDSSMIYFSAKQQRESARIGYTRPYGSFVRGELYAEDVLLPRFEYVWMDNLQCEEIAEENPISDS